MENGHEYISRPQFYLTSAITDGVGEHRDMDLDIPGVLQQGKHLPSLTANAVVARYSLSHLPMVEVERNAILSELLLAALRTLKSVQVESNIIPVIGKYIRAAAEVGLSRMEIVETMNESDNLSASLESSPCGTIETASRR